MSRDAPLLGLDVNNFRAGLNLAAAQNEGLSYVLAKVGQGASSGQGFGQTLDASWPTFRDGARALGMPLAGYWYVGDSETPASQASRCAGYLGDTGIPLALDWEIGGGNWANLTAVCTAFRAAGLIVRMLYTRATYYTPNGGGAITDLDLTLWNARYPSTSSGTPSGLYAAVAADQGTYWQTYGGATAKLLQYADTATIAGVSGVDADAFDGTFEEVAALFTPAVPAITPGSAPGAFLPLFPDRVKLL